MYIVDLFLIVKIWGEEDEISFVGKEKVLYFIYFFYC